MTRLSKIHSSIGSYTSALKSGLCISSPMRSSILRACAISREQPIKKSRQDRVYKLCLVIQSFLLPSSGPYSSAGVSAFQVNTFYQTTHPSSIKTFNSQVEPLSLQPRECSPRSCWPHTRREPGVVESKKNGRLEMSYMMSSRPMESMELMKKQDQMEVQLWL